VSGAPDDPSRSADGRWLELVESIAHDLRSPLATLTGYLELATLDPAGLGDRRLEQLARAAQAARELGRQIEAAQLVARFEAGAVEPRPAERPLAALAETALLRIGDDERARLEWRRREAGTVRCDPGLVGRAISSLVSRALLRSEESARIGLSIERAGARLRFQTLDRGSRIAPEEAEQLFGAFGGEPGRRRSPKLDLCLARLVAEAHGGAAGATSGEGETALWIELPAV
jgi:two-component system OmpR family sensor kinase